MRMRPFAIAASLCASLPLISEEFVINLKNPTYSDGVVTTDQGGVIEAPNLRIQGRKIIYTNKKDEQKVFAKGDLMMEYQGQLFVGDQLEFDLRTHTGYLIDGRTKLGVWYMGGEKIELYECGDLYIENPFLTTSSDRSNPWKISARFATIVDRDEIYARNLTFSVHETPIFFFPSYRGSVSGFIDPPLRYRVLWDKGLGPRLSIRYRYYSTETFNAYARFDYRITEGPGGALEADYKSKDKRTFFQTRNYAGHFKEFSRNEPLKNFRFQGIYKTKSEDGYSLLHLQWDRLSTYTIVNDFRDSDFEVNTKKATYLEATSYQDWVFGTLTVRPNINQQIQTLNQELPDVATGVRSFAIWKTGIISENYARGSYLDYTYANAVKKALKDSKSGRLETINTLYRPISLWGLTVTPRAGIVGIYYSNSPDKKAQGQFLYTYGGDANIRFAKNYDSLKHTIEPYTKFLGYSRPSVAVDDYFVFDINDGYDKLNQLRFGIRQLFHSSSNPIFLPTFVLDLYSYSFWGAQSFMQRIPKAFADFEFNQPNYAMISGLAWNVQENVLDYGNVRFLYTWSANFAFGLEFRHRSKFWWRKAIQDNFTVDFARPLNELLASPLSDRRNTFLTKFHFRLNPRWNLNIQTHHGWGRLEKGVQGNTSYHGALVDFYTMVTGSWQMKLSYEYQPNDPYRFSYSFKLIK